jgi:hypothetical protein
MWHLRSLRQNEPIASSSGSCPLAADLEPEVVELEVAIR